MIHCDKDYRTCSAGPFIGRILLGLIFFLSGIGKIFSFNETLQYMHMAGIEKLAETGLTLAIIVEIVGGLSLILGCFTTIGSIVLMLYLIPTTYIFHAFWKFAGADAGNQMAHFMKNVAIFGGLLLLASFGPGRWSLDAKCCDKKHKK